MPPPVSPPASPALVRALALHGAGHIAEAMVAVSRLANAGEARALVTLAEWKWAGAGVPANPPQARALFDRAGAAGDFTAATYATNLMAAGIAGPRDWPAALARLAAEARHDPARREAMALIAAMALNEAGDPQALPPAETLGTAPRATLFPGLFTAAECDYLRARAAPWYQPSVVNTAGGGQVRDTMRTSDGATIFWLIEDPAVHALNRRLAAVTGTDAAQGEALQILRYRPGQQYRPHLDFVRASDNQRFLTALVYLNHDYDGGETAFIKTGLKVKGRRGDALVFANADAARAPDPLSEHAGLPVTRGTKYLASRWIREARWAP